MVKNVAASAEDLRDTGLIPGLERSPGGRHSNPFQYSCLENPYGQTSLVGCSLWGHKESDTTEQLSIAQGAEVWDSSGSVDPACKTSHPSLSTAE